MSSDKLSSLLDEMLDDSAIEQAARDVEEREAREAARAAVSVRPKEPGGPPELDDIVQLTGLTEPDLRKVLGAVAPDDLLVVIAAGDEVIQRRVLRNLGPESVQWIRDNIAHMGEVNEHEAGGARAKMLKVANQLLASGDISIPEPESVGTDEAPDPEKKELRELLTDLVRIAEQSGAAALTELAEGAGEPLLREGLGLVAGGARGDELRGTLAGVRNELEQRYAQRLKWMVEALVAISEREGSESFAKRVFRPDD